VNYIYCIYIHIFKLNQHNLQTNTSTIVLGIPPPHRELPRVDNRKSMMRYKLEKEERELECKSKTHIDRKINHQDKKSECTAHTEPEKPKKPVIII